MTLKPIFVTSSAVILALVAIMAKAKKPFTTVNKIFYTIGSTCKHFTNEGTHFTTGGAGMQASFRTQRQGGSAIFWGACTTIGGITVVSHPVHFTP